MFRLHVPLDSNLVLGILDALPHVSYLVTCLGTKLMIDYLIGFVSWFSILELRKPPFAVIGMTDG